MKAADLSCQRGVTDGCKLLYAVARHIRDHSSQDTSEALATTRKFPVGAMRDLTA